MDLTMDLKEKLPAPFTTSDWYELFLYVFSNKEWGIDHTNDYVDVIKFVLSKAWVIHAILRTRLPPEMASIIVKGYLQPTSMSRKFSILTI